MIVFVLYSSCVSGQLLCPDDMVYIKGGQITVGADGPLQKWEEDAHRVQLSSFCIDRYEYPNKKSELPLSYVTFPEARSLCLSEGKRLCTSAEWEHTCRGVERRRYSYGQYYDSRRCNTPIQGGGPGKSKPPIAESGAHKDCRTPEGVYDLNGNLSEWVSDSWSDFPEPFSKYKFVDPNTWRTLRGGTMWSNTFYGQECSSRHGHKLNWKNHDDGFRCCSDTQSVNVFQ